MLKVSSHHLQEIQIHAKNTYPEECCGLLLGKLGKDSQTLVEVLATENSWDGEAAESFAVVGDKVKKSSSRHSRFSIAPEVMLKAQQEARDRHLDIIGVYHSHPDHPAIPSEFDRLIAWQQYSYIIISVQQGKACDLRSWRLDDNHQFQPEEIETCDMPNVET